MFLAKKCGGLSSFKILRETTLTWTFLHIYFFRLNAIILKESIRFRADNKRAVLEKIELL